MTDEEIIEAARLFNIGDEVWIPICFEDEWYIKKDETWRIVDIIISIAAKTVTYQVESNGFYFTTTAKLCFRSYKECKEWCKQN